MSWDNPFNLPDDRTTDGEKDLWVVIGRAILLTVFFVAFVGCASAVPPTYITNLNVTDPVTDSAYTNQIPYFNGSNQWAAVTIGSGLSFSGGTLSSTSAGGTVTSFSAGTLSPLFTTSVATSTTTPALSFTLSNAAAGTLFGNTSGSATAPAFSTLSAFLDTIDNTQGDVLYRNASGWTFLSPGTAGYVLTTAGPAANPSWAASGAGSVSSVALTMPTGFSVSGSPITSSGTLAVTTSLSGILKGTGSGFTTATAGTDYAPATSGGSILYGNGAGGFSNVTVGTGLNFTTGTLSATNAGTVTSVAITGPSIVSWAGSPITSSGTFTGTLASQTQNLFLASPDGSSGTPTFRAIVAGDLPAGTGTVTSVGITGPTGVSWANSPVTTSGTLTGSWSSVATNFILGNPSNSTAAPAFHDFGSFVSTEYGTNQGDVLFCNGIQWINLGPGTAGQVLTTGGPGADPSWQNGGGTGTVTSVAITGPSIISWSGSPITSSGTFTGTLSSQSANLIFVSPNGSSGTPTFRSMVAADEPSTTVNTKTDDTNVTATISAQNIALGWTGTLAVSRGGIGIGTLASNGVLYGNGTSAVQALAVNSTATNKFLTQSSSAAPAWNTIQSGDLPAGTGTVTSVAQTVPAEFSVSGSPITTSGTLAITKATQLANTVWAGPTTGSAAVPAFRALVNADMPGSGAGSGTVTSVGMTVPTFLSVSGSPVTTAGTLAVTLSGTALPIANGGTSNTTASAAFNALSPLSTLGDMLYGGTSGSGTRLAGNTLGHTKYLSQTGTGSPSFTSAAPSWSDPREVYVSAWGGIAAADTQAQTTAGVVILDEDQTIASTLTVLSPVRVTQGKFTINSTKVLTLSGGIQAPIEQIFSGSGTVQLNHNTKDAWPEWWGAGQGGDDSVPINAALVACFKSSSPVDAATLHFSNTPYSIQNPITVNNPVPMQSEPYSSVSAASGCAYGFKFGSMNYSQNIRIPALSGFSTSAIQLFGTSLGTIGLASIAGTGGSSSGIELHLDASTDVLDTNVTVDNSISSCGKGAIFVNTVTNNGGITQGVHIRTNFVLADGAWVYFGGLADGASAWVSGGTYTSGQFALDTASGGNGYGYVCISNVSGSSTAPHSDATHWARPSGGASDNYYECDAVELDGLNNAGVIYAGSGSTGDGSGSRFVIHGFCGNGGSAATGEYTIKAVNGCAFDGDDFQLGNWIGIAVSGGILQYGDIINSEYNVGYATALGNRYYAQWGGNQFNVSSPVSAATSAGSRASFNGGVPIVSNRFPITLNISSLAAGATETFYFYSPFILGNARLSATWASNPGLIETVLKDNTSSGNANEGAITVMNISGGTLTSATAITRLLIGIP